MNGLFFLWEGGSFCLDCLLRDDDDDRVDGDGAGVVAVVVVACCGQTLFGGH